MEVELSLALTASGNPNTCAEIRALGRFYGETRKGEARPCSRVADRASKVSSGGCEDLLRRVQVQRRITVRMQRQMMTRLEVHAEPKSKTTTTAQRWTRVVERSCMSHLLMVARIKTICTQQRDWAASYVPFSHRLYRWFMAIFMLRGTSFRPSSASANALSYLPGSRARDTSCYAIAPWQPSNTVISDTNRGNRLSHQFILLEPKC